MGKVYKAFQPKLQRYVAVKTCNIREAEESGQDPARLEDEALTIARLNHPNIISLYDVYRDSEAVYLIMELLEGQPYSRFLNPKAPLDKFGELVDMIASGDPRRLVNEAVIEVGLSVARALEYAHQRKVMHRDVKPANIFITNDRHVKLLDFSIARNVNQSGGRTATGVIFGTVAYMSPEQILSNQLDGRTDIYSLGCTLYHLATGQTPYPDPNEITVCMKHVQDPVPDPMLLNEGISPLLGEIIRKCLQKEPSDRYSTAKELADEFKVAVGSSQVVMPGSKVSSGSMVPILSGSTTPPPSDLAEADAQGTGGPLPPATGDSSGVTVLEVDDRGLPVIKKSKSGDQNPTAPAKVPTPPPPTRPPESAQAPKPAVVPLASARSPEPPPATPASSSREKKVLSLDEKAAKAGGPRSSSSSSTNGEGRPLAGDWIRPKTTDWAVSGHSHDMSLTEAVFGGGDSAQRRQWFEEHKKMILLAGGGGLMLFLLLVIGIVAIGGDDDEPTRNNGNQVASTSDDDPITVAVANPTATPLPTPEPTARPTPEPSPTPKPSPTELPVPQAAPLSENISRFAVGLPGGRELILVEVSPGSFFMGSPEEEAGRDKDEGPLTKVEFMVPFFIAEKEITVGQWKSLMGENSIRGEDALPASNISWEQATEFCRRLTASTGLPCFLPTEAQWEYSCRSGTQSAFVTGEVTTSELANIDGTVAYPRAPKSARLGRLAEPGSYPPNSWGLFDMHGNLWELTFDSYAGQLPGGSHTGLVNNDVGAQRVLRGGSWKEGMGAARSASREAITSSMKKEDVGFRVVIEL